MPQELQVLQCYSCETYQVHIIKKSAKWCCKMCGEKQSLKQVFGKGSGKDCRLFVQELNETRVIKQQQHSNFEEAAVAVIETRPPSSPAACGAESKWTAFIAADDGSGEPKSSPNKLSEGYNQFCCQSSSVDNSAHNFDQAVVRDTQCFAFDNDPDDLDSLLQF